MTERCQMKFVEKFENQNCFIYAGFLVASISAVYFYRFHFVTITVSYLLGCLACYYGLNSSLLDKLVNQLKCHFVQEHLEKESYKTPYKGCITCGSKECLRHDGTVNTEPWVGLQIHKQLDQAIEDFYNTILDQFINTWYSKITLQPFFVDELKHQLRYASACLLRRAVKINYSRFITERLIPCALHHYTLCAGASQAPLLDSKLAVHPAAANRNAELKYLRCITNAIMPYLLKNAEVQNPVFNVLIREIFAGWVLLSLTDVLADPYILNTLVILATGDETMAHLPDTPNYRVEFLETFVRQTDSVYLQRSKLLQLDLEFVINDQDHLYAFMQFMKTTNHLNLLQFYKDIKLFQTKILNPELEVSEQKHLHKEARVMYDSYLSAECGNVIPLQQDVLTELSELLSNDSCDIKTYQTSRALYQAARQSHTILEKNMLPKFLHSEEYYKLLIGSRIPTGYQKNMVKKPHEKLKLSQRLKLAVRSQLDDHILTSIGSDVTDGESVDNDDILKYLDSISVDDEQDLSTYKVVLTDVETCLQAAPRRGAVRVFTLCVHRAGARGPALWRARRTEHDFHLLRSKLHEYHGDRLLHDLPLPSRRDNSPLETLRYKYEDFLQRLLQKSLLQTSELLHLFLTVNGDFSMVVQASTLNATSSDLANIYQSVTQRLRKEKGQHLESFLKNLLVSSDIERFQALKQGNNRDVEEAQEVNEDEVELEERRRSARDIHGGLFGDNFGVEPPPGPAGAEPAGAGPAVRGFTQCLMYLLTRIINARTCVVRLVGGMLAVTSCGELTAGLEPVLRRTLCERRLAHFIRLGQALLFGKKASTPRSDVSRQRELARKQLMESIPYAVSAVIGPGLLAAVHNAFEIIQSPQLNKQLVYNLLDACVVELFPELATEPKC